MEKILWEKFLEVYCRESEIAVRTCNKVKRRWSWTAGDIRR